MWQLPTRPFPRKVNVTPRRRDGRADTHVEEAPKAYDMYKEGNQFLRETRNFVKKSETEYLVLFDLGGAVSCLFIGSPPAA